jgi:hypothetical protein
MKEYLWKIIFQADKYIITKDFVIPTNDRRTAINWFKENHKHKIIKASLLVELNEPCKQ